jgi:hypothetical protein
MNRHATGPWWRASDNAIGSYADAVRLMNDADALLAALRDVLAYSEAAFQDDEGEDSPFAKWDRIADKARSAIATVGRR